MYLAQCCKDSSKSISNGILENVVIIFITVKKTVSKCNVWKCYQMWIKVLPLECKWGIFRNSWASPRNTIQTLFIFYSYLELTYDQVLTHDPPSVYEHKRRIQTKKIAETLTYCQCTIQIISLHNRKFIKYAKFHN